MRSRQFWLEGPGSFALAIGVALLIRWLVIEAFVIPSSSMAPTLFENDHIFVNKYSFGIRWPFSENWFVQWGEVERGQVIVFKHPTESNLFVIKRVVGLPGDRIFYDRGQLYVNDRLVEKTVPTDVANDWSWVRDRDFSDGLDLTEAKSAYIHWQEDLGRGPYSVTNKKELTQTVSVGPLVVPPDEYFVLGDNRDHSQDSRDWGKGALKAKGQVRLTRASGAGALTVPSGTVVRTDRPGSWSQAFQTEESIILKEGASVTVKVAATQVGSLGNVPAHAISIVEGPLANQIHVENLENLLGGEDRRFVPRRLLIGPARHVWLSCEKKISLIPFLCHPFYIRWGRIGHSIR